MALRKGKGPTPTLQLSFPEAQRKLVDALLTHGGPVDTGHWQSLSEVPMTRTYEISGVSLYIDIPSTMEDLQAEVQPNLPWAEDQFQERIGGKPLNPGDTFHQWPYYRGNVEKHKEQGKFSHTYMERFWPKWDDAGRLREGIRYQYGDFNDVVDLLTRFPYTRQAYLPIFFPEDTGAIHGERIPCTLGYHFLRRDNRLHVIYHIRSCDFLRHFTDDVYMAARLAQEVIERTKWAQVEPGNLTMHIGSLHIFEGEVEMMRRRWERGDY